MPVPLSSKEKLRLCERVRRIDLDFAPRSFFLYEKSVLRESDCLRGREGEVCTDLTSTPFPPLKKMGFQRDASTMRRQRRISEFGFAEFLGAS